MTIKIDRTEVNADKAPHFLWDNFLLDGTVTATSETDGGEVENALEDSTWDFWVPQFNNADISVSFSSPKTVNALGIASHDLGTIGADIRVTDTSTIQGQVSPTDDSTILLLFDEFTATDMDIRIRNATNVASIGNIMLGYVTVFENGIVPSYTPLWMSENIELLENMSLSGQFFQNRVVKKSATTNVNLNILERSTVEGTEFQNFREHYNNGKSFYFAAGPSVFENDVSYCRRTNGAEMKPTFSQNGIFYDVSLGLEAFIG